VLESNSGPPRLEKLKRWELGKGKCKAGLTSLVFAKSLWDLFQESSEIFLWASGWVWVIVKGLTNQTLSEVAREVKRAATITSW